MEKAMKLGFVGWSMAHQTAEIAEAGQLIDETAVDQESDDSQERRLGDGGAPPVRRGRFDDRMGYAREGKEGGDDGDNDGDIAEDDLSLTLDESITHGSDQVIPFARQGLVPVERRQKCRRENEATERPSSVTPATEMDSASSVPSMGRSGRISNQAIHRRHFTSSP